MKKKSRTSTVVLELPCEILHENILTRLPVKSLLRFRCVCKSWCELIRTPRFVKIHNDQYKNDPKLMLVSITKGKDDEVIVYSLEYGEKHHSNVVEIPISAGFQFRGILGSCNGLVCCTHKNDKMYLWNPSTGEYKLVPVYPGLQCRLTGDVRYPTSNTLGFGYNASAKDYEIILISAYCNYEPYFSRYSIYSLRKNSWTGFQDMSPYLLDTLTMGELVNDALHWVGVGRNNSMSIIAFDIGDRKFRELQMPPTRERTFLPIGVVPLNGCLSIMLKSKECIEAWMMKDYGVKESWTKVIKLNHPDHFYNPYSVLKCFSMNISTQKTGFHDMGSTYTLDGLLSKLGGARGNTKAEQLIAHCHSATSYTETLVPLQGYDDVMEDQCTFSNFK